MRKAVAIWGVAFLAALTTMSCGVRWGNIVLIPENFEGWVTIKYEVPEAAPLKREGLKTLIQVPASGEVTTSSTRATGYGPDEYYFIGPGGSRRRLPNEFEGCHGAACAQRFTFFSSPARVTVFFVGRAEDVAQYSNPGEGIH